MNNLINIDDAQQLIKKCKKDKLFFGEFVLVCDQPGMISALNCNSTVKNDKYARWRPELAEFDCKIQFRPGVLNVAADALSRCSPLQQLDNSNVHRASKPFIVFCV